MNLKKLGVLALVIGTLVPLVFGGLHAAAITPDNIPTDIRPTFLGYDNGPYDYNGNTYSRGCSDIAQKYLTVGWVSKDGDPGQDDITVPYGTASVPLEWEFVDMLCKDITTVDGSTYPGLPRNGHPQASGLSLSTIHSAVLGSTVTVNRGTVTLGDLTSQLRADQSTDSRYWFSNRNSFGYNLPANLAPGTYRIDIRFKTRTLNTFFTNTYQCVDNDNITPPGTNPGNYYTKCPEADGGASFTLTVAAPTVNFSLTPSVQVDQTVVGVGSTVNFSYNIDNSGPTTGNTACTAYATQYAGAHTPFGKNTVTGSNVAGYTQPSFNCSNLPPGNTKVATEPLVITPAMAGQTICRSLHINPGSKVGAAAGSAVTSPEACVTIVNKPFFQVTGGDVAAGLTNKAGATACTQRTTGSAAGNAAIVKSWNYDNSPAGNYYGAGAQTGVFALGQISSFISGANPLAVTTPAAALQTSLVNPYDVSFSKTVGANIAQAKYGGSFGQYGYCADDYVYMAGQRTNKTSPGGSSFVITPATASGTYTFGGTVTVSGALGVNQRISVVSSGNIVIGSNLSYPAGVTTTDTVPYFEALAAGSIYVNHGVTSLYGFYDAQGGTFATCATGTTETTDYNTCNSQLTIDGAVDAKDVHFDRTFGNLQPVAGKPNDGKPSEIIRFSPALWIGALGECTSDPTLCSSGGFPYDAITSLPPVL